MANERGTIKTARHAYADACRELVCAGFPNEEACQIARELLSFCRGIDGVEFITRFDEPLNDDETALFQRALRRLLDNEPMAYITGRQDFGGLEIYASEKALIPRGDTMVLVKKALEKIAAAARERSTLKKSTRKRSMSGNSTRESPDSESAAREDADETNVISVLELGCGSGAVTVALALESPYARFVATDVDSDAIEVAKTNIARFGLTDRVALRQGSWFEAVGKEEKYDLIISNPPYLSREDMSNVDASVKKEPFIALWGGEDGLDSYRQIISPAYGALADQGWCIVEIGWRQGSAVAGMFEKAGFTGVEIINDEGVRNRIVIGQRLDAAKRAQAGSEHCGSISREIKKTICARVSSPDDPCIARAGNIIRTGGLVAFPTETVYGLGANGLDADAVAGIFAAKSRPPDNPLILHVASVAQARELTVDWTDEANLLAEKFWPGPLTMILPAAPHIPEIVTAGLDTVALRFPSDPLARALIKASGVPIAAPSANTSGRPSTSRAEHVLEDLDGKIDMIIDNGPSSIGFESTIIDLSVKPPVILRPGMITREDLSRALGEVSVDAGPDEHARPKAPGMKYRHYAPKAPLTLLEGDPGSVAAYITRMLTEGADENTVRDNPGEADPREKIGLLLCEQTWNILDAMNIRSASGPREIFRQNMGDRYQPSIMGLRLYHSLRECDRESVDCIYVEACEDEGQGAAVLNRLRKAATRATRLTDKKDAD